VTHMGFFMSNTLELVKFWYNSSMSRDNNYSQAVLNNRERVN
jgi:hypothetical protein